MVTQTSARLLRQMSPFALGALLMCFAAQPALAATEVSHTGTTGKHSLSDTTSSPGVTCNYVHRYQNGRAKLVEIVVKPPNVRAAAGKSGQLVGWSFEVQRRVQGIGGADPWQHRYTSPEKTATTDDSHDAAFSKASVPVKTGKQEAGGTYQYRVFVTMTWYRSDSSVQGTARDRVDHYEAVQDIGGSMERDHNCFAWTSF